MHRLARFAVPLSLLAVITVIAGVSAGPLQASDVVSISAGSPRLAEVARAVPARGPLVIDSMYLQSRGEVELRLERFSVFTEDAVILVGQRRMQVPHNVYFRGWAVGISGSRAVMSFKANGAIDGLVVGDGEVWHISSRAQLSGLSGQRLQILEENTDRPFDCQADDLPANQPLEEIFDNLAPGPDVVEVAS